MKVCLYVNVKNEKRIIEFIKYYLKIGIDYFIIFDDNSLVDVDSILKENNINKELYDVLYNGNRDFFFGVYNTKSHWENENLPLLLKNNIDYVFHVDADEFLFLGKYKNIKELIENYQNFDSLRINWLVFGSNNLIKNETDSIISQFKQSANNLAPFVKCITKVSSICLDDQNFVPSPHVLSIISNGIKKNIFNEITENTSPVTEFLANEDYYKAPIYIAHYVLQDIYTFIDRKVCSKIFLKVNQGYNLNDKTIEEIQNNKDLLANFIKSNDTKDEEINFIFEKTALPINTIKFCKEYYHFIDRNDIYNEDIIKYFNI